ncbi:MAG: hypothetical protein LUD77_07775 [Clostridiales bacterium]|nr:hypothetical protein [Clostridiales bacterium]
MRLYYFTILMFKRYFKNIPFMAVIVIIPLCCLFLKSIGLDEDIKIKAGIYTESSVDTSLFKEYDGAAEFIFYNDIEKMKNDVSGRMIECGYYFTENLPEVYSSEDIKNSIICYKSPATAFDKVINEIIFSELFYSYAYNILEEFAYEKKAVNTERLFEIYNSLLNTDAVISLKYEYIENSAVETETVNVFGFLRGILGIYIMLGGILGGFYLIKDFKTGFGKSFSPLLKTVVSYTYFTVPAVLCGASSLPGLYLSGNGSLAEVLITFFYSLAAAAFGALVCCFFNNEKSLISALTAILEPTPVK